MSKPAPPPLKRLEVAPPAPVAPGLALHRVVGADADGLVAVLHGLVGDGPGAKPRFPGPNPVSLERSNLAGIDPARYWVCEKTDGVRFALLCCTYRGHRVAALVDRKLAVYVLPLRRVPKALFQGTVLDGEVAHDKHLDQHQFLVFDAVMASGIPLFHKPFSARLADAARALRDYWHDPAADPLAVSMKCFYRLTQLPEFVATRMDAVRVHFDVDGVVLSPEDGDVVYGRHMKMFKFNPFGGQGAHTVDFLVGDGGGLHVYDGGKHTRVGALVGGGDAPAGSIAECRLVEGDGWELVGIRTDKTTANDMYTYQKTMLNIRENLSLDDLPC
jgi:hypothetical protein